MRSFIKTLEKSAVFDANDVTILSAAFEQAWKSVQTGGSDYANEKYAPRAREILAKYIIETAEYGERNQRQLAAGALLKLSQSNLRNMTN